MLLDKLIQLRKQKQLRQEDIAQYLQITRQAYSSYETGKREMDFKTLCQICDYYKVSADYLLGRYDSKPFLVDKDDEIEIVKLYRTLDERGKATIKANLKFEAAQVVKPQNPNKKAM